MKVVGVSQDSPAISKVHLAGSNDLISGTKPLLRTNICLAGVISSSNKCGGVSALRGLSLSTTKPSFPAIEKGSSVCAKAAGISPPGIFFEKGIVAPMAVTIASRPLFLRKPRRLALSVSRFQSSLSALIGSSAYNSCIPLLC